MLTQYLVAGLPVIIIIIISYIATFMFSVWKWSERKKKNPLTIKLLRAPGESLLNQVRWMDSEVMAYLCFSLIMPLLFISVHLTQSYLVGMPETMGRIVVNSFGMLFGLGFMLFKLLKTLRLREKLRLGLDAERAVGQELNKLAGYGYRIFHDTPANKFNIDHVVVGKNGVFALETKGRSRRKKDNGKADWKVIYEGDRLIFPGWQETKPISQVKSAAHWLSQELTKAIGEPVNVTPVLCIAGWYIDRKSNALPYVFNGKSPDRMFPNLKTKQISDEVINRIAYQVEQWVNDVEPNAHKVLTKVET